MQRSTYPSGETTASRIKSLVLWLEQSRGRAEADALLGTVKLSRADIDAETRAIGVAVWHLAVEAFAGRWGRDTILETWPGVISRLWSSRKVRSRLGARSRFLATRFPARTSAWAESRVASRGRSNSGRVRSRGL